MALSVSQKGQRAKEILEDDVFLEVVKSVRESAILQWTLTEPGDVDTRENLYMHIRVLDEVIRGFRTLVADWKMKKVRDTNSNKGRLTK
tara:strand:- start:169 stop:435 length:267 start_codon:yes stop_codon:yes gene_type:complete